MSYFSPKKILITLTSIVGLTFLGLVFAVAPNPGHTWSELGDVLVTVAQGGTGLTGMATGGILYASATDTFSRIAPSAANQVLRSTGANALQFAALVAADLPSFDVAKITSGILSSVYGGTGNGFTKFSGPTTSEKTFTLPNASANILTDNTDVTVAQGGTGLGTLTLNNVILGNGTSTPLFVAPGANGNVLTSDGTTWTSAAPAGGGGSNALLDGSSHTDTVAGDVQQGDLIIGDATPKWVRLPHGNANQVLTVNAAGTDVAWGESQGRMNAARREMYVYKNGGAATISAVGLVAPTLTATASSADDASAAWLNSATTAVSGNASGVVSLFTVLRMDWQPEYMTRIKTDAAAITTIRYWIGLFSAAPDAIARGTGTIRLAAFSYDTGLDGTAFWRTVTSAGVANTFTTTTTTTAIAANTEYKLYINCTQGGTPQCLFYINDVLVATHTANLPTATLTLGYANRVTTLTTAIRNLKTQSMFIRTDH